MKTAILIFPGTNREHDMADAVEEITGKRPGMIWHKETELKNYDLLILPGGFSYGDYLRCGAMAAHSPIMKEVIRQAERGTRIFGVCNGFQMLVETRILPGALLKNKSLKFICKQTYIRPENTENGFTGKLKPDDVLRVPVAHGDGNYFANDDILQDLKDHSQIAFRYCSESGESDNVSNFNGSVYNIAGIFNKRKTILGMMPHPENATLLHQPDKSGVNLFKGILENIS